MADNWRELTDNEKTVAKIAGTIYAANPQTSIKQCVAKAEDILTTITQGGSTVRYKQD